MNLRIIVIALGVTFVAACGANDHQSVSSPEPAKPKLEGVLAKEYHTFAELRADSTAVAEIEAGDAEVRVVQGGGGESLPETITTVRVIRVLWGSVPSTIKIVQVGDTSFDTEEVAGSILQRAEKYLVFIRPSPVSGVYTITGSVTAYHKSVGMYRRTSTLGGALPATIDARTAGERVRS